MRIANLSPVRIILLLSLCALIWTTSAAAQLNFDGALAICLLDEGGGSKVKEFSGNDNGGEFEHFDPEWVEGKFGKALEFEQHGWVEMNNPVVTVKGMVDFSMGCWANPKDK